MGKALADTYRHAVVGTCDGFRQIVPVPGKTVAQVLTARIPEITVELAVWLYRQAVLSHRVLISLHPLLGIGMPCLACQESDVLEAVLLDEVAYKILHAFIVIREDRMEILALLVYRDNGTLCSLMSGFLHRVRKTRRLDGIEHEDYAVKVFIGNEGEYRSFALLTRGAALVLLVHGKDADVPVKAESLLLKTADEFGLIILVTLTDKYRDPLASYHQSPLKLPVIVKVILICGPVYHN